MAKKEKTRMQWLMPHLRNIARMWPEKSKALNDAKVKVQIGFYQNGKPEYKTMVKCRICQDNYDRTEIQMDHINPVVNVYSTNKWDAQEIGEAVISLLCNKEGYQALCKSCHYIKTQAENEVRRENKKKVNK